MNRRAWRLLIPPAVLPLALWVFVTVAGPGGVVEFDGGSASATVTSETDSDAVQPADVVVDDGQITGDVDADGTSQPSSDQPSPAPSTTDSLPGKSEDAPGEPAADPQLPAASDQGQQTADANGNGPANAPGQNQP